MPESQSHPPRGTFPRGVGTPVRGPDRLAARRHRLGRAPGRSRGNLHRAGRRASRATSARHRVRGRRRPADVCRSAPALGARGSVARALRRSRLRRHLAARLRPDHAARRADGFRLLDFRFTGWGGKFEASRDDQLIERLVERRRVRRCAAHADRLRARRRRDRNRRRRHAAHHLALPARTPSRRRSRDELTRALRTGCARTACCGSTTAISKATTPTPTSTPSPASRPDDAIVFQALRRPDGFALRRTAARWPTKSPRCARRDGKPYRLFPLPWAQPILDDGPPPRRVVRELPDRQRRGADAGLRRSRRCAAPPPCLQKPSRPRDRAGPVPPADLAERQPALHHHAIAARTRAMTRKTVASRRADPGAQPRLAPRTTCR